MAIKTAVSLVQKPGSYAILNSAGQTIYTAAVPELPVLAPVSNAPGYSPGVVPVQQASFIPTGIAASAFDFMKKNPILILAGAAAIGLLLRKKARK